MASDLGILVVTVGKVIGMAEAVAAGLVAAKLCIDI